MSIHQSSLSWVSAPKSTNLSKLNPRIVQPNINAAIEKGLFNQVRYLIEFGARVNQRDGHGRTPLMNTALVEDTRWGVGLARLLLEKGARPYIKDSKGRNAVHFAVIYERIDLLKVYFSAIDFKIDDVDKNGNTLLHYSAACGNLKMTSLLLNTCKQYGIDANKTNRSGNTALIVACKMKKKACANMLAESDIIDCCICNCEGKSGSYWLDYVNKEQEDDGYENDDTFYTYDRPDSVCSMKSHSTVSSGLHHNFGPLAPGRHSRLRTYTPLGGKQHYSNGTMPSIMTLKKSSSRIGNFENVDENEEQTTSRQLNSNNNKLVKSVSFSKSTEQINNILNNRHSQQIQSASPTDFRNKPQCVFHVSPLDCFESSKTHRPQSVRSSASDIKSNIHHNYQSNPFNLHNWRGQVKDLFDTYGFQFEPSYNKFVIPEPDPEPPYSETGSTIRPLSGSTRASEMESETSSLLSKPRSAGRRQSLAFKAGTIGTLQVAGDPSKQRRPSICSNTSTKPRKGSGRASPQKL